MQVNYSETIRKSVHITDDEANRIVMQRLYRLFKWGSDYHIKSGEVITTNEYLTSHRFEMEEVVREASEEDFAIEAMFEFIKNKMKEK